jgi:RNA recognition motif-containing protein
LIHNKKADREDQGERYTNLFVQNLPSGMNDGQLKELFNEYGDIVSAQMNAKNNNTGFVSYKNHTEAKAAKDGMDAKLKMAIDTNSSILVAPLISQQTVTYTQYEDLADFGEDHLFKTDLEQYLKVDITARFEDPENWTG